ncbi:MAG TPA: hypothetical protein VGQ73_07710, partial [Gemmatimonadales bacterium]|nr:hypothetical protein [Gemmatimonadales bacterium]
MEQPFPRLDSARLRISAGFSLTSFEQLPSTERNRLQRLDPHASWAAALVPTELGWRRVHLVGPETAALLAAFRVPALPPASTDRRTITRLVLDGILEAEHGGKFLSGPAAHPLFFQRTAASIPRGPIQALSLAALRYAEALGISDPLVLAQRLYLYNTRPASPRWRARLPDARAVAHFLEGSRTGRVRRAWRGGRTRATTSDAGRANWRIWDCRRARRPSPGAPTFKLYLSPELDAVGDAWRAARDLFSTAD